MSVCLSLNYSRLCAFQVGPRPQVTFSPLCFYYILLKPFFIAILVLPFISSLPAISASREIEEFIRPNNKTMKNTLPWMQIGCTSIQQPYTLILSGTVSVEIQTR